MPPVRTVAGLGRANVLARAALRSLLTPLRSPGAEIGHSQKPDKLMVYRAALHLAKLLVWDKVLGFGIHGCSGRNHGQSRGPLLRQTRLRERCKDHQAVKMVDEEIKAIVAETLAEQHSLQQESIDAIVSKAVASSLASFGIEDDDRKELRADFQHLRRWRKSVDQAQRYTLKAVITVIATGLMGAVLLGVQVVLGK